MTNLDTRISNPDQLLTTDIDKFCDSCTDLYSNIAKPLLDIGIYVYKLTSSIGGQVTWILSLLWWFIGDVYDSTQYYFIADTILHTLLPGDSWYLLDPSSQTCRSDDCERTTTGRRVSSHQFKADHQLGGNSFLRRK